MGGLNREQAAAWVSKAAGYRVPPANLSYWESTGLLRRQRPGNRVPAEYRLDDLLRLRLLVELRLEGAPLQRIRRAVRNLVAIFPDLRDRPGSWTLAVLSNGDVVHASGLMVTDLTGRPGQSGWLFLIDAREYVGDAGRAIAEVSVG